MAFLHPCRIRGGSISRNGSGRGTVHRYGDRRGGGGGRLAGNSFFLLVAVVTRAQHRPDEGEQLLHVIVELIRQTDHTTSSIISAAGSGATFAAELIYWALGKVDGLVAPSTRQQQSSAVLAAAPLLHKLLVFAAFWLRERDSSCNFWSCWCSFWNCSWYSSWNSNRCSFHYCRTWCSFRRYQGHVDGCGGCGCSACDTAVSWHR